MDLDTWKGVEAHLEELAQSEARLVADLCLDHVDTAEDRSLEHSLASYREAREELREHRSTPWDHPSSPL